MYNPFRTSYSRFFFVSVTIAAVIMGFFVAVQPEQDLLLAMKVLCSVFAIGTLAVIFVPLIARYIFVPISNWVNEGEDK